MGTPGPLDLPHVPYFLSSLMAQGWQCLEMFQLRGHVPNLPCCPLTHKGPTLSLETQCLSAYFVAQEDGKTGPEVC